MMEPFERIDIQELPLRVPTFRRKVEDFLGSNGLRLGEVDLYLAVLSEDGAILAGGGLQRDILQCLAVSAEARSLGLSVPLISRLISVASDRGYTNVKVFTKPENRAVFESLGFRLLAEAPKAILLENGRGLEDYCNYLRGHRATGVILMNANPFTLGHRYLVEQAESRNLVVIPVKEDVSRFSYAERLSMIRSGCGDLADVVEGSDYQISAATFPTYFLKDLSDAAETQMRLDIDLFGRHIAPAIGARVRFVGSEPADPLTARYNALMRELLPKYGVKVVEIPRLTDAEGPVTATRVRALLDAGSFKAASALTPASTWPYLLAELLRQLGIDAEAAMLAATGGVNTHRGAIFALGLALNAALRTFSAAQPLRPAESRPAQLAHNEQVMRNSLVQMYQGIYRNQLKTNGLGGTQLSHGGEVVRQYGVKGARELASEGYQALFEDWLPYYRNLQISPLASLGRNDNETSLGRNDNTPCHFERSREICTLLRIMATLDDTCVIHRAGYARAQEIKAEASALAEHFDMDKLKAMCERYAAEGISPGGAADMLALTILIDSILN